MTGIVSAVKAGLSTPVKRSRVHGRFAVIRRPSAGVRARTAAPKACVSALADSEPASGGGGRTRCSAIAAGSMEVLCSVSGALRPAPPRAMSGSGIRTAETVAVSWPSVAAKAALACVPLAAKTTAVSEVSRAVCRP